MKNKEEEIELFLKKPLEIGDWVHLYKNKSYGNYEDINNINENDIDRKIYTVIDFIENNIKVKHENTILIINKKFIANKSTYKIGYNPFPINNWQDSVKFINSPIESLLHSIGFDKIRIKTVSTATIKNKEIDELNWKPYFLINGNKVYYQRDFCWSINDKKLLIESIISGIDIGKFVFRRRSYDWIVKQLDNGNDEVAFKDIIDGKQRLNAILGFIKNEYSDLNNYYFKDYSQEAQNKFFNFNSFAHGEMGENSTDEEVKKTFLNINFSGEQMSEEHINFVKSINL